MTLRTITPLDLVPGTESIDLVGAGEAVNAGDTFQCDVRGRHDIVFLCEEQGGGAAVVTFDAGDYPPSAHAGDGLDTVTLATSDFKAFQPIAGRHIQDNGKVTGSVATNNVKIFAIRKQSGY